MTDSATTTSIASSRSRDPRRRRPLRRAGVWLLIAALMGSGAWWTLTRSPLVKVVLRESIQSATGLDARIDRAIFAPFGRSVVEGLHLTSPAIDGPGAKVLDIAQVSMELDPWSAFDGLGAIRTIEIDAPVLRVTQSDRTGAWNLSTVIAQVRSRLAAQESAGAPTGSPADTTPPSDKPAETTPSRMRLPEVAINGLVIEISEHSFDNTNTERPLGRVLASGRLVGDGAGSYRIELDEQPDSPKRSPDAPGAVYFASSGLRVEVEGTITQDGIDLGIGAFDLSEIAMASLPRRTSEVLEIMDLRGRLDGVRLTGGGLGRGGATEPLMATLSVDGVGVTLPINRDGAFATEGTLLRMTDTTGTVQVGLGAGGIEADMRGTIAGLSYSVRWSSQGLSTDAGFEAQFALESARIQPDNDVLVFIPTPALEPFELFGKPTLTVDANVTLTRPAGGEVAMLGVVSFRDGTASYQRFPYEFINLEGTMTFTGSRTDIHRIVGVARNGATVEAHGWMGPYDNDARADITVIAKGVPIDNTLRDAMDPDIRGVVDMVFNQPRYAELLATGLVRRPGQAPTDHHDETPETRSPDSTASHPVPEFALGGTTDVVVRVTRQPGEVGERWETTVEATIAEAGMLPEPFAYPIIAQDIKLFATERSATLRGGRYRGLSGGGALMDAQIGLGKGDDTIRIDIRAVDIPVDDRLVHALPNPEGSQESVQRIVERLRVEGVVDANAGIRRRESGRIGYDVEVTLNGIAAQPDAGDLRLDQVAGTAYLTENFLLLDTEARVSAPGVTEATPIVALTATVDLASVDIEPVNRMSPGAASPRPESLKVRARSRGFDPALPVEQIVTLFTPSSAASLIELRERHRPSGHLDLSLDLTGRANGSPKIAMGIAAVERFEVDAIDGRVAMGDLRGTLALELDDGVAVAFDACSFDAWYNGDPLGRVAASGGLRLDGDRGVLPGTDGFALDAGAIRFESPFVRTIAERLGGADLDALLTRTNPRGQSRVQVEYHPASETPEPSESEDPTLLARISPRFVRLQALSGEVLLTDVDGALVVDRNGGTIERISGKLLTPEHADPDATGGDLSSATSTTVTATPRVELDGAWSLAGGVFDLPLRVSIAASRPSNAPPVSTSELGGVVDPSSPPVRTGDAFGSAVLALLPPEAVAPLNAAQVRVLDTLQAENVLVHLTREPGAPLAVAVDGAILVQGIAAIAGAPITEGEGTIAITRAVDGGFDIAIELESVRVAKGRATNAKARLVRTGTEPVTRIEDLVASMHGGRLTGHGILTATPTPDGPKTAYEMTVSASGVGFDALLGDIRGTDTPSASSDAQIRAELTVAGFGGETLDRTGRGLVEVDGSRLIDMPIVLPLIEMSNLQVPTGERLEMARTEFFISGDYVTFDELSAFSDSIELFGYGVMRLPTLELDLRIHSEGARKVPVLSNIVESVRDELVTVSVGGTLAKPEVGTTGLRGTRRLIAAVFGVQRTDDERRLEEIEQRARERRRSRSPGP